MTQLSLFEQFRFGDPDLTDEQVVQAISEQVLRDADARPPVNVEILASVCGISDVRYHQRGPAGMLFEDSGRLVASIRDSDGLRRTRFTVCHEGGHTFLEDYKRGTVYRCSGPHDREERLSDVAAAELLLPRVDFLNDLLLHGNGLQAAEDLADHYVASMQATALRIVTLSIDPVLLLCFKQAHKPTERGREGQVAPKLRLQWSAMQGTWPFVRKNKSVSATSPIARAWEGEIVDELTRLDELFGRTPGRLLVDARRYGDTVLALVRRPFR